MANPSETMRKLEGLERAQLARTEAVSKARKELETAEQKEDGTFRAREDAYRSAFQGGFFIERVLRPNEIWFVADTAATHVGHWLTGHSEQDPVSSSLSEIHAGALAGKFATSSYTDLHGGSIYGPPKSEVGIRFEVAFSDGEEAANVLPDSVWDLWQYHGEGIKPGDPITVAYRGVLKAIEWRLPTEEEVATFGQLNAQAG